MRASLRKASSRRLKHPNARGDRHDNHSVILMKPLPMRFLSTVAADVKSEPAVAEKLQPKVSDPVADRRNNLNIVLPNWKVALYREYVTEVGQKLGVTKMEDWTKINYAQLAAHGLDWVLKEYGFSPLRMLKGVFPEHEWIPWATRVPRGFWHNFENHKWYCEWLGAELGIKELDQWYSVPVSVWVEKRAKTLLPRYQDSQYGLLRAVYPHHKWQWWRFPQAIGWNNPEKAREFLEWVGEDLGYKEMNDWYNISTDEIKERGGKSLLDNVGSIWLVLNRAFPEHNWDRWRFRAVPEDFWQTIRVDEAADLVEDIRKKLDIRDKNDWYRVSGALLRQIGSKAPVGSTGGLPQLLMSVYSEHKWEPEKFKYMMKKSTQLGLLSAIREIFRGKDVIEEYHPPSSMSQDGTRGYQLDAYLPSLELAFEYQGELHFQAVASYMPMQSAVEVNKYAACAKLGITLIEIPYWWDGSIDSLANTIHKYRPDLIPEPRGNGEAIPEYRDMLRRPGVGPVAPRKAYAIK